MGFELDEGADESATVTVGIGNHPSYKAIVTPGAFVPALKGVHCLPTLSLTCDEIRLSCTGDSSRLRVVRAVLSARSRLISRMPGSTGPGLLLQFDDGYYVIDSGVCREWVSGQRSPDATPY